MPGDQTAARARNDDALRKSLQNASDVLRVVHLSSAPQTFDLVIPSSADCMIADAWGFDWIANHKKWAKRTNRFGCAMLSLGMLCGLALGFLNRSGRAVNVTVMQSNPLSFHPFKGMVFDTVELAAVDYALRRGAEEVRLIDPVPGVRAYYESKGFIPGNDAHTYYTKKVK